MNLFLAITARLFPVTHRFSSIAIGNLTDTQMRRSGLTKAAALHRTFSGLTTCN